jgi:hypothetical protein
MATIGFTPQSPVDVGKDVLFTYSSQWLSFSVDWDFGDGTTAKTSAPIGGPTSVSHAYKTVGTFAVKGRATAFPFGNDSAQVNITTVASGGSKGGATTGQQGNTDSSTPSLVTGLLDDLLKHLQDPKALPDYIRSLYGALILSASALSFIPTEANFGGALASIMIHDVLDPFRRRVFDGTIDLQLRPLFPTDDLSPRILVTGLEAGAFELEELLDEAARSGTRPEAIKLLTKVAQVKRFDAATKDDYALVRTYHSELIKATIADVRDQEKAIIADLTSRRKELVAELKKGVSAAA